MQNFLERLADGVTTRDAEEIARTIGGLISDGTAQEGALLPPIRTVASTLGVSSSTVSAAWTILRRHGLIETDRRRGTTVRSGTGRSRSRYWQVPSDPGTLAIDLSTGTPDPELLPQLAPVLAKIHTELEVTSYLEPPVLPELEEELRSRWPYLAPDMTVVDGANDALDRIVASFVHLGDVVIVEDPTYPLILDILEHAGAQIVGVPLDEEGPRVDAFEAALQQNPSMVILQTGAHNPTGVSLTQARADELVALVEPTRTIVVEDDHAGAATTSPPATLGASLPDRVYRVHSFSKTYGPDLRIAALAGPADGIEELRRRRQLGPGWTSRLTQRILLEMFQTPGIDDLIARASIAYAQRREGLRLALASRDIVTTGRAGLNLWVPVGSEHLATVGLAAQGIGVAVGAPFRVHGEQPHVRVTTATLRDGYADIADAIARSSDPRQAR